MATANFTNSEIKEFVGKRLTVDGERSRITKVLVSKNVAITDDGVRHDVNEIFRKGRGLFIETKAKPKTSGGRTPKQPKQEVEVENEGLSYSEVVAFKDKRITVNGEHTKVEKLSKKNEVLLTADGQKISFADLYKKGRGLFADIEQVSKKDTRKPTPRVQESKPANKEPRQQKIDRGSSTTGNKKSLQVEVEETEAKDINKFTESNSEEFVAILEENILDLLENNGFNVQLIGVGASFNADQLQLEINLGNMKLTRRQIANIISNQPEVSDIVDESEEDETEDNLDEFDLDSMLDEIDEDEDEEDEDEDEEDEDLDEEDEDEDEDLDEEDEDEDEDLDEEDEDEDEDEDLDEEDEDEDEGNPDFSVESSIEFLKARKVKVSPRIQEYVENYYDSNEVEEYLGDELIPGKSVISDEVKGIDVLLLGFDSESGLIRTLNLENGKLRSYEIIQIARMEFDNE